MPPASLIWGEAENTMCGLVKRYGYQEIRTPVLEPSQLFNRSVGESTDIVEKEMYAFEDQGGQHLAMRPEGTASTVRALLNQNILNGAPEQRLWYLGPMFRRERAQKGRYRQFYQLGVEAFGFMGPDIEVEQILLARDFWRALGLEKVIRLEVNTLGDKEARARHREALVAYFKEHHGELDEDSVRRLDRNPLRILDSKNPAMQDMIEAAPKLIDYLDDACQTHFDTFLAHLDALGISYRVNKRLVRGLDYYTRTVFEWTTESLGAQGTVCAGGHYDGLVESWGGPKVPGCGFALGIDRLVLLLEEVAKHEPKSPVDVYWVLQDERAQQRAWEWSSKLRAACPGVTSIVDCGLGKFKQQFKRADRSGATLALILGEEEYEQNKVSCKDLREGTPQETLGFEELLGLIKQRFEGSLT